MLLPDNLFPARPGQWLLPEVFGLILQIVFKTSNGNDHLYTDRECP